jgi:hypothetical protein
MFALDTTSASAHDVEETARPSKSVLSHLLQLQGCDGSRCDRPQLCLYCHGVVISVVTSGYFHTGIIQ